MIAKISKLLIIENMNSINSKFQVNILALSIFKYTNVKAFIKYFNEFIFSIIIKSFIYKKNQNLIHCANIFSSSQ